MEKLMNCVKNGVSKLPPGFRFLPTDEELVFQYLKCKIFKCQLPTSIIPEINVCKFDPWDLPGNCEQERYFFSSKEAKYRNGNRMNRTTKSGYWKATGSDKKISSSEINNIGIAGIRKSLVFYEGKSPNSFRTDWVMHEYRLLTVETTTANYNSSQSYLNEIGDWVLCRIFRKKTSIESNGNTSLMLKNNNRVMMNIVEVAQPRFFDFMRVHNKCSPTSSSCSSCSDTTDVSSLEYEETSDYYC